MSKIELEQISENEVEVVLPPNTPMEMVTQLVKGLNARGLVEDLAKSTLSVRYFSRPVSDDVADKLIKSLQRLTKDELPYWHPKSQFENQKRVREMEIAERRAKNGIKQPANLSPAPEPHVTPDAAPKIAAPAATTAQSAATPAAYTASHPRMFDQGNSMNTAGGTGKRYAYINDPVQKEEDDVEKSGYGPKGGGQYTVADNIRRKAKNTGEQSGFGSNVNTKEYTSVKFQGTPQTDPKLKRPQPVKTWSPEQIAAENEKRGLKKSWGQHLPFPSAEEEIMKLAKATAATQNGEDAAANQLASLMMGKQMLGKDVHPAIAAQFTPPPSQPTNQELFGHLVVTEEMAKNAENKWNNSFNNWMQEASKPISQRFASQAEEEAYWANIKVDDRDDGKSGY